MRRIAVILLLLPALLRAQPSSAPASSPAGEFLAYPSGPADLRSPGFHKLTFQWIENGQTQRIPFSLYLPQGYGQEGRRWPMLTFLAGLGDRGSDPGTAMAVGVPLEIGRNPDLARWMPMIVLTPQCPANKVWDSPGMAQSVLRLIRAAAHELAADPQRLYVTGFSDGGKGTWVLAAAEPRLFAAVAPIVSREYAAEQTAAKLAGSSTACLILSGQKDPKSEPASSLMAQAMRRQNVPVTHAMIPEAEHFIWRAFYSEKLFYTWLLAHRLDEKPQQPPGARQFIELYQSRQQVMLDQQIFDHRLQRGLDRFEPYWFIDNCAMKPGVGLRTQALGRRNVFVTLPLAAEAPCRLQTTRQLPAGRTVELLLEVGAEPGGDWELLIRVNEQEVLRQTVSGQSAPNGWLQAKVSLQRWAGQEARLQLIHKSAATPPSAAFWTQIRLLEAKP